MLHLLLTTAALAAPSWTVPGKRLTINERWIPWLSLLSHVFDHDLSCPGCGAKQWVVDTILGPWRVRRELLALGIDRSPQTFAPARGPPTLW